MAAPTFKLDGLAEAQKALRAFGGTSADAKAMNKQVVDEVIVPPSKAGAPVRSGRLRASIGSDSTATHGIITAGGQGDVRYAGVIHFGWSTRGLGGNLGGAAKERRARLSTALGQSGQTSTRTLTKRATNKAARLAGGTKTRGRVRGGPIRPNPWIYEAIDGRHGDVFEFYEKQLEHRAEIEGLL